MSNKNDFNLIKFTKNKLSKIEITGLLLRTDNELHIKYLLQGDLSTIIIPQENKIHSRQYDLWEHTCFEFFLRLKDTTEYWEFNLSPSGNWNVFHFLDYRLNIAEEQAFSSLPFTTFQNQDSLELEVNIDLDTINIAKKDLDIAITTVVENKDRQLSYWALAHPATEADFHHQDSFIISI